MIYDTADAYYHSFLSGSGAPKATFGGGGGGQGKVLKAKGSDGKYQGE